MAQVCPVNILGQSNRVSQVAVMCQSNTVWRVDIKRLCFSRAGGAGRRVTHMANTHVANQTAHVPTLKYIAHHAVVLAQEKPVTVTGNNTGSVLTAMLQHGKRIINRLIDE